MAITFVNTMYLWFLLVIPLIIISHFFSLKLSKAKAIKFANFEALSRVDNKKRISRNWFLLIWRILILSSIILSIASPTYWYYGSSSDIDYVVAIDSSGSMLANDFTPTRLRAAKYSASLFADTLSSSTRLGVISFSGNAFIEQHLTDDLRMARDMINAINVRQSSGTAIGDAIITATNLFEESEKRSRVIILLTDGQNTAGTEVSKAVAYAKQRGVIIYTLGVGTAEGAKFGGTEVLSKLDEDTLKDIAAKTGGSYHFTGDKTELANAFNEITSKIKKKLPLDLSSYLVFLVLILLAIEWGIANTVYKVSP